MPRVNPPIADRPYSGPVAYDAKDPESVFPPIEALRPPADAPDMPVVLDDRGIAASSAVGGPCAAPVMERLAVGSLGYNHVHTTALCAHPIGAADRAGPPHRRRHQKPMSTLSAPQQVTTRRPLGRALARHRWVTLSLLQLTYIAAAEL